MPKPQSCRFVWQTGDTGLKANKLTIEQPVVQNIVRRRIGAINTKLLENGCEASIQ